MYYVFIARGVSCSGKSTELSKHFPDSCILSSDKMRVMLTGDESNQRFNAQVFDTMQQILTVRLKAGALYTVIDATNLKWKDSVKFIDIAESAGAIINVFNFPILPVDELFARSESRAAKGGLFVPKDVIERQVKTYTDCTDSYIEQCQKRNVDFIHWSSGND